MHPAMSYSELHLRAFARWKQAGGLTGGSSTVRATKGLSDAELTALAEDKDFRAEVAAERQLRAEVAIPPSPPAAQTAAQPRSALDFLDISEGETFEDVFKKNRSKVAPVVLVESVYKVFDSALKHLGAYIGASSTKNRDRTRQIADLVRALGIEPSRPPFEDRGDWTVAAMYYANDTVRRDGRDWRCLTKHRAETENTPGSAGVLNHWEELEAPMGAATDGTSILERLAAVERALGITPPEPR
jgi:hypothetical protein